MSTEDKPNQSNEVKAVQNEIEIPEVNELEQNSLELMLKRFWKWAQVNSTKISWAVLILSCAFLIYTLVKRNFEQSQINVTSSLNNTISSLEGTNSNIIKIVKDKKIFDEITGKFTELAYQSDNKTAAVEALRYLGLLYCTKAEVAVKDSAEAKKCYKEAKKFYNLAAKKGGNVIASAIALDKIFIKLNLGELNKDQYKKELTTLAQNPKFKNTIAEKQATGILNALELNKDFDINCKLATGKAKWQIDEENKALEKEKKLLEEKKKAAAALKKETKKTAPKTGIETPKKN